MASSIRLLFLGVAFGGMLSCEFILNLLNDG